MPARAPAVPASVPAEVLLPRGTIGLSGAVVKSPCPTGWTPDTSRPPLPRPGVSQKGSGGAIHGVYASAPPSTRPNVLSDLPLSCRVVFDVVRSLSRGRAPLDLSIRDLAEMCRLSPTQTRRALVRLRAVKLLSWQTSGPGRGHTSNFVLLWHTRPSQRPQEARGRRGHGVDTGESERRAMGGRTEGGTSGYPQRKGSPYARETVFPGEVRLSLTDGQRPFSPTTPIRGERAHRWAMARIREEVNRWPISPERRATVLAGVGPPLWRAVRDQEVRTRGELAAVVRCLVRRLQEAEGISGDLRTACRYGQWAVREALKRLPATESPTVEATEGLRPREGRISTLCGWARKSQIETATGTGPCPHPLPSSERESQQGVQLRSVFTASAPLATGRRGCRLHCRGGRSRSAAPPRRPTRDSQWSPGSRGFHREGGLFRQGS